MALLTTNSMKIDRPELSKAQASTGLLADSASAMLELHGGLHEEYVESPSD